MLYQQNDFKLRRELLLRALGPLKTVDVDDFVFNDQTISMAFLREIGIPVSPNPLMEDYAIGLNRVSSPLPTVLQVLDGMEISVPKNIGSFPCLDCRSDQILYIDVRDNGAIYANDFEANSPLFVNGSIEQMLVSWATFIDISDSDSELSQDIDDPREAFEQLLRLIDARAIKDPDKTWWGAILSDDLIWI